MTTIPDPAPTAQLPLTVVGGVDTYADTHTAAAIDTAGRSLGHAQFPTTCTGYAQLTAWLHSHGQVHQVGVEGTGAYGAGLTGAGIEVVEVDRPDRKTRRPRDPGQAGHRHTQDPHRPGGGHPSPARGPHQRSQRPCACLDPDASCADHRGSVAARGPGRAHRHRAGGHLLSPAPRPHSRC